MKSNDDYEETGRELLDSEIDRETAGPAPAKKERRFRFNILDVLILVLLAGTVFLAVYAYFPGLFSRTGKGSPAEVEYSLRLSSVPPEYESALTVGGAVSGEKGGDLGRVISVESLPAAVYALSEDGKSVVRTEDPNLADITVKIRVTALDDGTSLTADGTRLAVGAEYAFTLPGFSGRGICVSIDAASAG